MAGESVGLGNVISYPSNIGSTNDKNASSTSVGYTLGKADFAQHPMSMRKFLEPFDHNSLTDSEAGSKYAAYKTSFARQQLEEFFERNKNSPWFREKYHPDTCPSSETKRNVFKYRLSVFMELYEGHKLDNLVLSGGHEVNLVRLLDTIGIKLLGGTDEDVAYHDDYERYLQLMAERSAVESANPSGDTVTSDTVTSVEKATADINVAGCDETVSKKASGSSTAAHTEKRRRRRVSADGNGVTNATLEEKKRKKKRILAARSARATERRKARGEQNNEGDRKTKKLGDPTSDGKAPGSDREGGNDDDDARSSSARSSNSGSSGSSHSDDDDEEERSSGSSSGSSSDQSSADSDSEGSSAARGASSSGMSSSVSGTGSGSSSDSDTGRSESGSSSSGTRRRRRGQRNLKPPGQADAQLTERQSCSGDEAPGVAVASPEQNGEDGYERQGESDTEMIVLGDKGEEIPPVGGQDRKYQADEDRDLLKLPDDNGDEFGGQVASVSASHVDDARGTESSVAGASCEMPTRRPLHHTKVLFLPHIPFSVYKKDLNALFSTSPHFLRLAVLDPFLMPSYSAEASGAADPLLPEFGPSSTSSAATRHAAATATAATTTSSSRSSLPVLRRVGWATFAWQQLQTDDQQWVDVDVESIHTRLLQQATEAQAPGELLDCLRNAKVILDSPLTNSASTRIRTNNHLMSRLMDVSPLRLHSKSLLRRHLVLAARLVYDLDRYRGLWQEGDSGPHSPATNSATASQATLNDRADNTRLAEKMSKEEPANQQSPTENQVESGNSPTRSSPDDDGAGESSPPPPLTTTTTLVQGEEEVMVEDKVDNRSSERRSPEPLPIDPGEDLLMAANILNSLTGRNPLLYGLTDYLVDEGSAEEELLLAGGFQAISFEPKGEPALYTEPACDNSELVQALDRLIFYLRVVHSVDFYAPAIYPDEEAMPHPCRLMHVRPHQAEVDKALGLASQRPHHQQHRQQQLVDHSSGRQRRRQTGGKQTGLNSRYEQVFSSQLNRLLRLCRPLVEADCRVLGLRNVDDVVEAFIQANTKRKKRKADVIWVCPLSDKKFRDPIYVRKHIMNKHLERIEATKKENAFFFNNYLMDAARPQLPLEPRMPKSKRRRKTSPTNAREADGVSDEHRRSGALGVGDGAAAAGGGDRRGPTALRVARTGLLPNWQNKPSMGATAAGHWLSRYENNSAGLEYPDRRPLPFPGYRQHRFPPRVPFYPQHHHHQQHAVMGVRFPRPPFNQMRGSRYFGGMRRGFNNRPYVDLDAP